MKRLSELSTSESGVTSIEYALLGALIAAVIVVSVGNVGSTVSAMYDHIAECVRSATNGMPAPDC